MCADESKCLYLACCHYKSPNHEPWRSTASAASQPYIMLFFRIFSVLQLLSSRTAMWSMPVVLTEWEFDRDSQNHLGITSQINDDIVIFIHKKCRHIKTADSILLWITVKLLPFRIFATCFSLLIVSFLFYFFGVFVTLLLYILDPAFLHFFLYFL